MAPGEWYTDNQAVGRILGRHLNRPDVRYIGHYLLADFPWLHRWLGLVVYRKGAFDTAFAVQTMDEYASQGLEWLSLAFTNRGRYDPELLLWKKTAAPRVGRAHCQPAGTTAAAAIPGRRGEPASVPRCS